MVLEPYGPATIGFLQNVAEAGGAEAGGPTVVCLHCRAIEVDRDEYPFLPSSVFFEGRFDLVVCLGAADRILR